MFFRRSRAGRRRRQQERTQTDSVAVLPDGCGYMGRDFGAPYIDAQCFGGQLYDLDNGESGRLYEPMDYVPCPECNHAAYLENCIEEAESSGLSDHWNGRPREFIAADKLRYPQDHAVLQAAYFRGWDESRADDEQ